MEFVEIGGIKWATCNVGAEKPTDTGLYFQWGDRKGYTADEVGNIKRFNLHSYKHYNGNRYTKYNRFGGKRLLDLCDDAAFAYMGHGWRMPTAYDFSCLVRSATPLWTVNYKNSGVAGMLFTDRTDESKELFFPAAGYCYEGSVNDVNNCGYYWSRSLKSIQLYDAYLLFFRSGLVHWDCYDYRRYGYPVRGILTD